ncbi:MAG TPA: type II secretion system protein GspE, partial [Oceanicaulis sp.]|nr:type II secretion system protein GspE [Oceanicaulis sp.]
MSRGLLTYAFAREHGIAFQPGDAPGFLMRGSADPLALAEAVRAAGMLAPVTALSDPAFDRALSEIYAANALAASREEAGQGDSLSRLIEDMPQAEDLLASDSEAPVIRLINGLVADAIRAG